jgi:hypothetical protein
MEASELLMSSTTKELPAQSWGGVGEHIKESIRTPRTFMLVLRRLGMLMALFLTFRYWGVNEN